MARTNWSLNDVMRPEDLNQIGTELNEARSLADAAETRLGAQVKADAALELARLYADAKTEETLQDAKLYADAQVESIPIATTTNMGLMSAADKSLLDGATTAPTPNTFVKRAANGTFKAAAPVASDDVARKFEIDNLKLSVSDGKALVAGAITDKGVPTPANATFQMMAENIGVIVTDPSGDATATAADLLEGRTAYSKKQKITGTIPTRIGHVTGQSISRMGTTIRIRPQRGYMSGDAANSVQWDDTNFLAENIREGKSLFGLNGTLAPYGDVRPGEYVWAQVNRSEVGKASEYWGQVGDPIYIHYPGNYRISFTLRTNSPSSYRPSEGRLSWLARDATNKLVNGVLGETYQLNSSHGTLTYTQDLHIDTSNLTGYHIYVSLISVTSSYYTYTSNLIVRCNMKPYASTTNFD